MPFLLGGKKLQDLCRTKLGWDWRRVPYEFGQLEKLIACPWAFLYDALPQAHHLWQSHLKTNSQLLWCKLNGLRSRDLPENHKWERRYPLCFSHGKSSCSSGQNNDHSSSWAHYSRRFRLSGRMITRELEEPVESKFYWSESTAVLKYIQNVKKLFHLFVDMKRTAAIQLMTHHLWKDISYQENIVELLAQVSDRYPILSGHYFPATWTTSLRRI